MKNRSDIYSAILFETKHAMAKKDFISVEYYLYYIESTPERDGGILATKECPGANYFPITGKRIPRNMTPEQYAGSIEVGRLPVLSIKEYYV